MAEKFGVCRLTVQRWFVVVGARCLDVCGLLEVAVGSGLPLERAGGARGSRLAAHGLGSRVGGTLAATQLGTALFWQAVLLFRSTPVNASDFEASPSESSDTGTGQCGPVASHGPPPSQSQGNRPLATPPDRKRTRYSLTPTSELRGPVVRAQAKPPVVWPDGRTRPISLVTLYRWVVLFRETELAALRPVRRKDAGKSRAKPRLDRSS